MLELTDGMLLYHGSYTTVSQINLAKCNAGLDFGKGFYLTTSYEQAKSFVPNSVRRNIRANVIPETFDMDDGQISVFRFHATAAVGIHTFQDADLPWLHFVAANRNHELFPDLFSTMEYMDIVGGKIANDNTTRVLTGYVTGLFGEPGSQLADDFAIRSLLPNRLENQFCFRTEAAIATLEFVRSDRYGNVK